MRNDSRLGILPTMQRPSVAKQVCYWVLALALFGVRLADAHVHVCLDGQEPRASLHVADDGVHHAGAATLQSHNDRDLKVSEAGAVKKGDSTDLLILAAAWSLVDQIAFVTADAPQSAAVTPALPTRSHLRPPLRGPPC